jgi:long-chain acyl-CoA synthetase
MGQRTGRFEQDDGGTPFLDGIGEIRPAFQAKAGERTLPVSYTVPQLIVPDLQERRMINRDARVLDDLITCQAEMGPERSAILFEDRTISYGALLEEVDRAARMLLGLGIGKGDRLGLMFPNRPEMLFLYFACFRIGVIVVPVNTRYQRQEIEYALGHSECQLLIVDERFLPKVEGLEQSVPLLERIIVRRGATARHGDSLHIHLHRAPAAIQWPQVHGDDPAVIFYTSGSTSRPKGVTHTHFSLLANARTQVVTREIGPDIIWLVSTGVGYVAGLSGVTIPAFLAGCTLVLVPDLEADRLLEAIERHRVETTLVLPTLLLEMLESPLAATTDLSSLKACFVAGDECSPDLYSRFRQRMGRDLLQAFGMTECEGYLSNRPSGPSRNGTVGKPAEGIRLRLVDSEGRDVAKGQPGEILVQGDSVMIGYWEDPQATREALRDGWLHGGDIATCDEEGFYRFRERRREIIVRAGSNVGPHEVEDVIDSHPDVKESCVVGVRDTRYGAIIAAYIEWEPGCAHRDLDALRTWTSDRLAAYKVPERWHSLDALPKTATGKIDRKRLHSDAESEAR